MCLLTDSEGWVGLNGLEYTQQEWTLLRGGNEHSNQDLGKPLVTECPLGDMLTPTFFNLILTRTPGGELQSRVGLFRGRIARANQGWTFDRSVKHEACFCFLWNSSSVAVPSCLVLFLWFFCCYSSCSETLPSHSSLWTPKHFLYFSSGCCIRSFSKARFSLSVSCTLTFPLLCCIFPKSPVVFFPLIYIK